jgi:hypothetical protein
VRLRDDQQLIHAAADLRRHGFGDAVVDVLEEAIEGGVHDAL